MIKKIGVAAGCIISLGVIAGTVLKYDATLVKANSLTLVATRLDVHIIQDRINFINQQLYLIEDRYGTRDPLLMPTDTRQRYRDLIYERQGLERKLKKIMETQ